MLSTAFLPQEECGTLYFRSARKIGVPVITKMFKQVSAPLSLKFETFK